MIQNNVFALNRAYGGFEVSQAVADILGVSPIDVTFNFDRNDPQLIAAIREVGLDEAGDSYSKIELVEIPEEATDYLIDEYDGAECLLYVLDGRIHEA